MLSYIALLRGINVGGHRVTMERLRELFRDLGLSNVRTYIQSGNIFFETDIADREALTLAIEEHLLKKLGYGVPIFLRTPAEMEEALQLEPFKNVEVTSDTRLMVVFTREELRASSPYPVSSDKGNIEILSANASEVFVVMRLTDGRMGDLERFLQKVFGKKTVVTTRFYDTTRKILKAAQST